jgi:hypothetical protein
MIIAHAVHFSWARIGDTQFLNNIVEVSLFYLFFAEVSSASKESLSVSFLWAL